MNGVDFRVEEVQEGSALIGGDVWWEGSRSLLPVSVLMRLE